MTNEDRFKNLMFEIEDVCVISALSRHLAHADAAYNKLKDEGISSGWYSWTDHKLELKQLKKDIKAVKRILKMWGVKE